jgi:hypothetical protein
MLVVREHLLRARHVARGALNNNRISLQINGDVKAVFEQVKVFIASPKQGLNVRSDVDVLLHSDLKANLLKRSCASRNRTLRHLLGKLPACLRMNWTEFGTGQAGCAPGRQNNCHCG